MYVDITNATIQELMSALDDNDKERNGIQWEIAMREHRLRELAEERYTVMQAIDTFYDEYDEEHYHSPRRGRDV